MSGFATRCALRRASCVDGWRSHIRPSAPGLSSSLGGSRKTPLLTQRALTVEAAEIDQSLRQRLKRRSRALPNALGMRNMARSCGGIPGTQGLLFENGAITDLRCATGPAASAERPLHFRIRGHAAAAR